MTFNPKDNLVFSDLFATAQIKEIMAFNHDLQISASSIELMKASLGKIAIHYLKDIYQKSLAANRKTIFPDDIPTIQSLQLDKTYLPLNRISKSHIKEILKSSDLRVSEESVLQFRDFLEVVIQYLSSLAVQEAKKNNSGKINDNNIEAACTFFYQSIINDSGLDQVKVVKHENENVPDHSNPGFEILNEFRGQFKRIIQLYSMTEESLLREIIKNGLSDYPTQCNRCNIVKTRSNMVKCNGCNNYFHCGYVSYTIDRVDEYNCFDCFGIEEDGNEDEISNICSDISYNGCEIKVYEVIQPEIEYSLTILNSEIIESDIISYVKYNPLTDSSKDLELCYEIKNIEFTVTVNFDYNANIDSNRDKWENNYEFWIIKSIDLSLDYLELDLFYNIGLDWKGEIKFKPDTYGGEWEVNIDDEDEVLEELLAEVFIEKIEEKNRMIKFIAKLLGKNA